jgi:hypothetical protein
LLVGVELGLKKRPRQVTCAVCGRVQVAAWWRDVQDPNFLKMLSEGFTITEAVKKMGDKLRTFGQYRRAKNSPFVYGFCAEHCGPWRAEYNDAVGGDGFAPLTGEMFIDPGIHAVSFGQAQLAQPALPVPETKVDADIVGVEPPPAPVVMPVTTPVQHKEEDLQPAPVMTMSGSYLSGRGFHDGTQKDAYVAPRRKGRSPKKDKSLDAIMTRHRG